MFVHRRVPKPDAGPEACGHRQGEGRAEVRKSDRQPAHVLRDVAFAVANQAPGPRRGPFVAPGARGSPGGRVSPVRCPSGTANSSPFAGLTGNARSATGAEYRSRGPCRRAEAPHCTADRGQCVSARGRNSNAGSAELASFAAWTRRERWEWPTRSLQSSNAPARCSRHRWSSHRTWLAQGVAGRPIKDRTSWVARGVGQAARATCSSRSNARLRSIPPA